MKKIYVIEVYPYKTQYVSAITISEAYAKKKDAEIKFSEDYLECCRCNDTTRRNNNKEIKRNRIEMKTYRGFDIVKKSANNYWIVGCGCVIGSAYSIQDAEEFIDYMIYED